MINIIHSHDIFHHDLIADNLLVKHSSEDNIHLRIIDFEFVNLIHQDMEHRLLKRWRHYDMGDLEETLKNLKLMDEEESLGKDGTHDVVSQFVRCRRLSRSPNHNPHIPL